MEILNKDQAWQDFAQNIKPGIFKKVRLEVSVATIESMIKYQGNSLSARKKLLEVSFLEACNPASNTMSR